MFFFFASTAVRRRSLARKKLTEGTPSVRDEGSVMRGQIQRRGVPDACRGGNQSERSEWGGRAGLSGRALPFISRRERRGGGCESLLTHYPVLWIRMNE